MAFEKDFGDGFVVATPHSAVESGSTNHRWMWQDDDDRTDYQFITDLVAHLVDNVKVDASRVFAGGHSSGGIFLYSFVSGGAGSSKYSIASGSYRAGMDPS